MENMSKKRTKRKVRGMWRIKRAPMELIDGHSIRCDGQNCPICRMLNKAKVDSQTVKL